MPRDVPAVDPVKLTVSTVRWVMLFWPVFRGFWADSEFIFGSCFNEFSLLYDSLLGSTTPAYAFLYARFFVLCVPHSFHFIPCVLNCSCAISSYLYMINMNSPGQLCQTWCLFCHCIVRVHLLASLPAGNPMSFTPGFLECYKQCFWLLGHGCGRACTPACTCHGVLLWS